jgi:hypothetical protein
MHVHNRREVADSIGRARLRIVKESAFAEFWQSCKSAKHPLRGVGAVRPVFANGFSVISALMTQNDQGMVVCAVLLANRSEVRNDHHSLVAFPGRSRFSHKAFAINTGYTW